MSEFTFPERYGTTLPAPDVSQWISLFPKETEDIFKLIYLADQCHYTANNRMRD